jgi:hypothetical protein
MTTATEAAFKRQFRLEHRDARVHQGAAADPGSGSSVSEQALTSLAREANAAYQSAQGASKGLPNDMTTALRTATPPPLQQGQARTSTGAGERPQSAQTDRTTARDGQTR